MKDILIRKSMYQCGICGSLFDDKSGVIKCINSHECKFKSFKICENIDAVGNKHCECVENKIHNRYDDALNDTVYEMIELVK